MYKKSYRNRQKGFTMIEVIISASIIAILVGISLANYNSVNKRSELNIFIQQMASDIRLMQNYALSSYEYKGAISEGGWGFYINDISNSYFLFADTNIKNKEYDGSNEIFKTVQFPEGITLDNIDDGSTSLAELNVTFVPPKPDVYIGNIINNYNEANITLKDKHDGTRTININYFGLVDVERN